jgi:hypothetical protein
MKHAVGFGRPSGTWFLLFSNPRVPLRSTLGYFRFLPPGGSGPARLRFARYENPDLGHPLFAHDFSSLKADAPSVFGFLLSHPCREKPRHGWGTHTLRRKKATANPLRQAQGRLSTSLKDDSNTFRFLLSHPSRKGAARMGHPRSCGWMLRTCIIRGVTRAMHRG